MPRPREKSVQHDAVSSMTPALRREFTKIRDRLARAERDDVLARHAVGSLVLKVQGGSRAKWGAEAVKQLERALHLDEKTLYRYALVARRWNATAAKALVPRTSPGGLPLTWSHLELIAEFESARRRESLVRMALAEGLSVRKLRARIAADGEEHGPASVLDFTAASFRELTAHGQAVLTDAHRWADTLARITAAPSPAVAKELQQARTVFTGILDSGAQVVKQIDEVLARVETRAGDPAAPPAAAS